MRGDGSAPVQGNDAHVQGEVKSIIPWSVAPASRTIEWPCPERDRSIVPEAERARPGGVKRRHGRRRGEDRNSSLPDSVAAVREEAAARWPGVGGWAREIMIFSSAEGTVMSIEFSVDRRVNELLVAKDRQGRDRVRVQVGDRSRNESRVESSRVESSRVESGGCTAIPSDKTRPTTAIIPTRAGGGDVESHTGGPC
ncbi:hypothetical protein JHW43_009248 [Diplocarpon mali]|nr:hypothetical protein JHW43_009248 [Diplocarpon mali]